MMRGDLRANHDSHGDQAIQRDSSSSNSSPRSSPEDIIEVNANEFIPKPIYNFSIPDVIKHDRHESHRNSNEISVITSRRKRGHPSRNNNNFNCETPISGRSKRQRRGAATAAVECLNDDDCHQPSVVTQVIDLTDIDSHDDYNEQSGSDPSFQRQTRPLRHFSNNAPFHDYLSNLERFHQQLRESRERVQFMRSTSLHGLQRLRRRRAPIITDGPLVTPDMLLQSPEVVDASTPDMSSHNDSVTVINEIRGNVEEDDHSVALRMLEDPNYSPPYHTLREFNTLRQANRARTSDESFRQFEDRLRALRSRNNEMSQQAHDRLTLIHNSISNLQRSSSSRAHDDNDGQHDENDLSNEVEFIREWNPPITATHPQVASSPLSASLHSPNNLSDRNSFPDFLVDTFFQSSMPQPRLQHLHNYEELLNLADRLGPAKQRGLSKAEIDLVPSFRFSKETAKETNSKCVVCMSEYTNREKLRRLPCTHDFHSKCIDRWLRSNITCPICRDEVNTDKDVILNDK